MPLPLLLGILFSLVAAAAGCRATNLIPDLSEARAITIVERQTAPPYAWAAESWFQQAEGRRFVGRGTAARRSLLPSHGKTVTKDVRGLTIPDDVAVEFLDLLQSSPINSASHRPVPQPLPVDVFPPRISIELELESQKVTFYTESPPRRWTVKILGEDYLVDSDIPWRALALLRPHLATLRGFESMPDLADDARHGANKVIEKILGGSDDRDVRE